MFLSARKRKELLRRRLYSAVRYVPLRAPRQSRIDPYSFGLGIILCSVFWSLGFLSGRALPQRAYAAPSAPIAISVVTFTPTPEPTATSTPRPTEIVPTDPPEGVVASRWSRAAENYRELRLFIPSEYVWSGRIRDEALIAMLLYSEFGIYRGRAIFVEATGALYNQYWSETFCLGECMSIDQQLAWLATMQGFYAGNPVELAENFEEYLDTAREVRIADGPYSGRRGWVWGNFDYWGANTSLMGDFVLRDGGAAWWGGGGLPYLALDRKWSPPFMVLTLKQAQACWKVDCMGLHKP